MKPLRFVLTALAVLVTLEALYLVAFVFALQQPVWPFHWLRDVYLVKDALALETRSPRWLIIGGSSAWFGLEGGLIENATGQRVVNLGVHGDIPLKVQLWQAERHLRAGDTVIMANELLHYWPQEHYFSTHAATEVAMMAPDYWWQASPREKYEMVMAVPPARVANGLAAWLLRNTDAYQARLARPTATQLLENLRSRWAGTYAGKLPPNYSYLELDAQGSMTRLRRTGAHDHQAYGLDKTHPHDPGIWRVLTQFAATMKARGVRCLVVWPPFEKHTGFDLQAPQALRNFSELRERLESAGWQIVGEPEDGAMASEFFYDTPFQLTTEGARTRTERLVERLRSAGLASK